MSFANSTLNTEKRTGMSIIEQADRRLWRKGFIHAPLRRAVRNLFFFSLLLFAAGIIALPLRQELFWAGVAAVLSFWNFYTLALFIQQALPLSIPVEDKDGSSRARIVKKGLLIRTQFRLFITGIFVYIALVFFQANPIALAVGLSSAMIIIPVSLIFRD